VVIAGPFSTPVEIQQAIELADGRISTYGRWSIPRAKVIEFLNDQGIYIRHTLDSLSPLNGTRKTLRQLAYSRLLSSNRSFDIQAEQNSKNDPAEDLPPVLPHELVKLRTAHFGKITVDRHFRQLRESWDEEMITKIEQQHRQLCLANEQEVALKSALDQC